MCNDYVSVYDDCFAPYVVQYDLTRHVSAHQCSRMLSETGGNSDVTHDFVRRRPGESHRVETTDFLYISLTSID
jgi:hypothetical protein